MRTFGLIGNPLTHSFSKRYFEEKFVREGVADAVYELFQIKAISELPSLVKSLPDLKGLNVTIPYKEAVMDYLDKIDNVALEVDAVNCIKVVNSKLVGYNTDVFGFENALREFLSVPDFYNAEKAIYELPPITAFVLGTGGSAKAVQYVLRKLGIAFQVVSRNVAEQTIIYSDVESYMSDCNLFINTTPLGMFPATESCADIPYPLLNEKDFLFDLVYNPAETLFLEKGKEKGCKTKNGLQMLQLQAEKSWQIWNGG
ncbi:MAG: shikimate dehydrogenase [Chitinophagales bacterium]|nr:shikimate dehydrogenase [Chitinophagales bacterium]